MDVATEEHLIRFARVLQTLATKHGLSNLRLAGDGQLIADVDKGKTLLDIARFELEAQGVLQATVAVISSRAVLSKQLDKGPLTAAPGRVSAQDQGHAELDAALAALDRVAAYVSEGRQEFERSIDRQSCAGVLVGQHRQSAQAVLPQASTSRTAPSPSPAPSRCATDSSTRPCSPLTQRSCGTPVS